MDVKQEILDIPRALRETFEKGRSEYQSLVRATRWGDGPLYVVASGPSYLSGLTAAYAFESMVGWPVVVRPASDFEAYSLAVLHPRSVLLAISHSIESDQILEAVEAARLRGATVLALTPDSAGRLARAADGVFLLRAGENVGSGVQMAALEQSALGYISLVAARILRRPRPQLDALEKEFEELPDHADWVLNQLGGAAEAVASEIQSSRFLPVVGSGFYYPVACQAAWLAKAIGHIRAEGFGASVYSRGPLSSLDGEGAAAFLSGSRCRLKKEVHLAAARIKKAGAKIITVTDAADRELTERSAVAVLLPALSEVVGSTLALVVFGWAAYRMTRERLESARPLKSKR